MQDVIDATHSGANLWNKKVLKSVEKLVSGGKSLDETLPAASKLTATGEIE